MWAVIGLGFNYGSRKVFLEHEIKMDLVPELTLEYIPVCTPVLVHLERAKDYLDWFEGLRKMFKGTRLEGWSPFAILWLPKSTPGKTDNIPDPFGWFSGQVVEGEWSELEELLRRKRETEKKNKESYNAQS